MRYFKSATFLLLTASSSVSLLSQSAVASSESPEESAVTEESVAAEPQSETGETLSIEAIRRDSTAGTGSHPAVASPFAFANSAESRVPQFSPLLRRLYPDSFANTPSEAQALANEPSVSDASESKANDADVAETAAEESSASFVSVEVEVIEAPSFTPSKPAAQNDITSVDTAQTERLTLEDLRRLIEADEQSIAQSSADENLPSLEDAPPAEEPDDADAPTDQGEEDAPDVDAVPDVDADVEDSLPTTIPDDTAPDEAEEPVESNAAPPQAAPSDTEINELPDILFADPNPLSFPTSPEEVDVDRNPTVTLEQAVELAYQNNQTLQASLLQLEQTQAALREAEAARLPTVSTGADLTNTQNDGSRTVLGGSVELGYSLLTGGSRAASIRAAELQQEVSALAVEAQQEQIRLVTATAYYALQDAGEQIRINQSFLDEAARNLRDSQLRQEVGVGTRFDTLRAEVQFANARQALIQSQGNERIARRDIARVLNLPPTTGLTTTPVAVAETWPLTLEDSILLAFQNRAELEQQLLQADISEEQRKIALAAVRPQLSLFARYSAQEIIEGATVFEEDFSDSVSVGARFDWTLYDGGASRASARQQEIGAQLAEEQFSENLDQIRFDVEEAFFNLQSNQENIATSEVAVAQAEEALELANLRLQAGVGTQLDVLTAQSELTEAEANNVTAILGYNRALVAMERAVSNVVTAPF